MGAEKIMVSNSLSAIWLSEKFKRVNSVLARLSEFFPTVGDIYLADEEAYRKTEVLTENEINILLDKDTSDAQRIMNRCFATGIQIICYDDPRYPKRLKTIENPPPVLYCLGKFPDFNNGFSVSLVGARHMSPYGAEMCTNISSDIAISGGIVVSGLALGIDALATAATLAVGGVSVAIVAFGVDVVYPKTHKNLRLALLNSGGAIISEYAPGTPFHDLRFRERNRLFGGIANCTLIVEGRIGGGTSLTASLLKKQQKPMYVIPANVTQPNSALPLELMQSGVKPVANAYDIFVEHEQECFSTINMAKIREKPRVTVRNLTLRYSLGMRMPMEEYIDTFELYEKKNDKSWFRTVFSAAKKLTPKPKGEINFKPKLPELKKKVLAPTEQELRAISDLAYEVYNSIGTGEKNIDDLMINRSYSDVLSALTMLELNGYTETLPGNKVKVK